MPTTMNSTGITFPDGTVQTTAASGSSNDTNMLRGSNFEPGFDSPWTAFPSSGWAIVTSEKYSGTQCLEVDHTATGAITFDIAVTTGDKFNLSWWIKSSADYAMNAADEANHKMRIAQNGPYLTARRFFGTVADNISGRTEWAKEEMTFTATADGTIQIQISLGSDMTAGKIFFDDIVLIKEDDKRLPLATAATMDFTQYDSCRLLLTADTAVPSNATSVIGQSGFIEVEQDAVGGHVLTWNTDWKFDNKGSYQLNYEPNGRTLFAWDSRTDDGRNVIYPVRMDIGTTDERPSSISLIKHSIVGQSDERSGLFILGEEGYDIWDGDFIVLTSTELGQSGDPFNRSTNFEANGFTRLRTIVNTASASFGGIWAKVASKDDNHILYSGAGGPDGSEFSIHHFRTNVPYTSFTFTVDWTGSSSDPGQQFASTSGFSTANDTIGAQYVACNFRTPTFQTSGTSPTPLYQLQGNGFVSGVNMYAAGASIPSSINADVQDWGGYNIVVTAAMSLVK